jgi:hypothetical protein
MFLVGSLHLLARDYFWLGSEPFFLGLGFLLARDMGFDRCNEARHVFWLV